MTGPSEPMKLRFVTAVMLSCMLLGCQTRNSGAVAGERIISQSAFIDINGQIRSSDIVDTINALRVLPLGSKVRLRVNSPGGQVFAALLLALELEKHDTTIEVAGNCHSACAQILLYSAKKIKFDTGANVILHTMPLSWIQYNQEFGRKTDKQYLKASKSLLDFYRRHQVPLNLVECGAAAQEPFGPTTELELPSGDLNLGVTVKYARRVKREGLYIKKQDLDQVFPQKPIIVGADNLQPPLDQTFVSPIDKCSDEMSVSFARVIELLDSMEIQ